MLAAVLVLGNSAQLGAAVLCVGSDGHVEVESWLCACCSGTASRDAGTHSGLAPASPSCDDCVDVPLKVPPLEPKAPQLFTAHINAGCCTPASSCSAGSSAGLLVHRNQMDQHWQTLSCLSTVVLVT